MRIVVTGATGMIGTALVKYRLERGDEVVALSRREDGFPPAWRNTVSCRATNYSREQLRGHLRGADAILHLAALRPSPQVEAEGYRPYCEANVRMTEQLILAAGDEGVRTLCQASSISVYSQHNPVPYRESDYPHPLSFYGASKIACEYLCELHAQRRPLRVVSLRLAQILGQDESRRDGMFMTFIRLAREKKALRLWGEGRGARDVVYLKDVAAAFDRALADDAPSGVFNIGGGRAYSHREVAETINDVFGNSGNLVFDQSRREDTSVFYMDCARAESDLGWHPAWTLRDGLEDMRREYEGQSQCPRLP